MISAFFALVGLVLMEIALGIDNVVFVSLLADKLPAEERPKAMRIWLIFGILIRAVLLVVLVFSLKALSAPMFVIGTWDLTGKELILTIGGLFLIYKAVKEIHHKVEHEELKENSFGKLQSKNFFKVVLSIVLIDTVFSVDSILTATGLASNLYIMIIAVVMAMIGMFVFSKVVSNFVSKNVTIKVLALCFMLLIGILLVAEGFGQHFEKGYIYFTMFFALFVELLNMRVRKVHVPEFYDPSVDDDVK